MVTKERLLFVGWLLMTSVLSWFVVSLVLAAEETGVKQLNMDLGNAVQHIETVKVISSDNTTEATIKSVGAVNLVGVKTNNFIISQMWDNKINAGNNSNILWWTNNQINWSYSSILWWSRNRNNGNYSTILWWSGNTIKAWWSNYSTILWWRNNSIKWTWSVIAWGRNNNITWDYSVIVWVDSSVNGNNSVALWSNSKVSASSSFLWTDETHNDVLSANNVFAVVSSGGMVVNANAPHILAQLTIGWPLVISQSTDDVVSCDGSNAWVMKVVDGEMDRKCLCGCDGSNWHSLYGQWTCEKKCNTNLRPVCGDKVVKCSTGGLYYFVWTCGEWAVPMWWMWAYVVTNDNKIHRSCQTDDWVIEQCEADGSSSPVWTDYCN